MGGAVTVAEVRFPGRLHDEARALVKEGWFEDLDSVLQEALRRYRCRTHNLAQRFGQIRMIGYSAKGLSCWARSSKALRSAP